MVSEWLNLMVRWFHVIAGIMWIGTTYLFNWMERELTPPEGGGKDNIMGELWMVHGGGFYLVEKQKWPESMPRALHWFKWESMMTWVSGMLLLWIVYWSGAPLLEYGSDLSRAQGIGVSIGALVLGWAVYNAMLRTPLSRSEYAFAAVGWVLVVALSYGLNHMLGNRAMYLHIGAMFGTIMVTNVWMIILPNQTRMLEITKAGGKPDPALAVRAGRCSKHNTYMSVPLIFTMISNHFPATTFGRDCNWAILGLLILVGWGAAKVIRDHL